MHYLGYSASAELLEAIKPIRQATVLADLQGWELERFYTLFIDEMVRAYLTTPSLLIQEQSRLHGVMDSVAGTINRTWQSLIRKLLRHANDTTLAKTQGLVADLYAVHPCPSRAEQLMAASLSEDYYRELKRRLQAVQQPTGRREREDLVMVIGDAVSILQGRFIAASLEPFERGYLLRKTCDAALATCRLACSQIVERVIPQLGQPQIATLASHVEGRLLFGPD
jgi:hypothetical protein